MKVVGSPESRVAIWDGVGMVEAKSFWNPRWENAYFSFTKPTTSPPLVSTAWTQTLEKPSFSSGY
jgi:hypothetical protein